MLFSDKLKEVQQALEEQKMDGWLLYDFHGSNALIYSFLEIPTGKMLTRRFFYWIPQKGDPIKIVPLIEPYTLDHLPGIKWFYRGWQELEKLLAAITSEDSRIAMEYSPYNALPAVSKVDAGTIDLLRRNGAEIVSSANLLQKYTCVWDESQLQSHLKAADILVEIVEATWHLIESSLQHSALLTEYDVQQFMLNEMKKYDCLTEDAPICAVNAHSADPHYVPQVETASLIQSGDFILLDLWCKQKQARAVYADITRVGVAGNRPSSKQLEVFNVVKKARDQATQFIRQRYEKHQAVQGWQVDQVARDVITQAGYGEFFIHRTGHNINEVVHGPGANLDNLETHDLRILLPGTCCSMEPGIYLPQQFGIRLEYDIYFDYAGQIRITGGIQEEMMHL